MLIAAALACETTREALPHATLTLCHCHCRCLPCLALPSRRLGLHCHIAPVPFEMHLKCTVSVMFLLKHTLYDTPILIGHVDHIA